MYPKIILKSGKDDAVKRYHPWVFSGAVKKVIGVLNEGDIVEVYSNKDEYLATGHYQEGSIAVRLFSFVKITPDKNFWKEKLLNAYNLRKKLNLTSGINTNAYRLVFAEGDGLPGLIIDYYNGVAVIQCHSLGMYNIRKELAEILKDIYSDKLIAIYDKSEGSLPKRDNIVYSNSFLFGDQQEVCVEENGSKFNINVVEGQKTGFFLDQRDNRNLVKQYSEGKEVLNLFCYTAAFSVYAVKGGAKLVHSVDSSAKAIELASKNISLNNHENCITQEIQADALSYLQSSDKLYDVMIVDPPAYAKHNDSRHNAIQGYKRLNAAAINKLRPGGILFTFSCSQVVDRNMFNSAVVAGAIQTGRNIRVLHQLSQPPDHPFSIFHPEGLYLKGLVLQVD